MSINRRAIATAAARGAKLLDKVRPGWFREINISALDLGNGEYCIIGQLNHGQFDPESCISESIRESLEGRVHKELRAAAKKLKIPGFKSCEIGFDLDQCLDAAVAAGLKDLDDFRYGFDTQEGDEGFSILTEAWIELIRERRHRKSSRASYLMLPTNA